MTVTARPTRDVRHVAEEARDAARTLARAPHATRVAALNALGDALEKEQQKILDANAEDLARAESEGLSKALLNRLKLTPEKLAVLADGARQVAALPDPVNRTMRATRMDDGLDIYQVTTPLGVVACVFESRPDAVPQISALSVKSGNAVLLKGGREAESSNAALADVIRGALASAGLPQNAVQLLHGRGEVADVLKQDDLVDLVIPRGSNEFVRHVQASTKIPVLGHSEGVCHVFVDKDADLEKALHVILDSKLDYPAACNAAECVILHEDVRETFLPVLRRALDERGVKTTLDESAYGVEFGDLECAIATVKDVDAAVDFVNRYGSGHTDSIVTENDDAARAFVTGVDAAGVYVNASTRFADGYRYGLGAEVGVSTAKVHARGPVGLEGLVLYKWVIAGSGQAAGDYGPGKKAFKHDALDREKPGFWSQE